MGPQESRVSSREREEVAEHTPNGKLVASIIKTISGKNKGQRGQLRFVIQRTAIAISSHCYCTSGSLTEGA